MMFVLSCICTNCHLFVPLHDLRSDPLTESSPTIKDIDKCVPPDERFSSKKMSEFMSTSIQATLYCLHEAESVILQESNDFKSFDEIHYKFARNRSNLEVEGRLNEKLKSSLPAWLFR